MTILPLDVDNEQFTTVKKIRKNFFIELFDQSFTFYLQKWRFEVVGKANGPNVKLLNEIEMLPFGNKTLYVSFDPFTAAAFLFPEKIIQKFNPYHAMMELQGFYTRGEMCVNRQSKDYNVFIIEKISADEFKKTMLWAASK